jgi:hypothetical protein
MSMSQHKPVLSVRIDQDLMDRLIALEDRTGVGRADIIERCLSVGLDDEEGFVKWLESPLHGPLAHLLTHPKVLKALIPLLALGRTVDPVQQKVRAGVREKKKGRQAERQVG